MRLLIIISLLSSLGCVLTPKEYCAKHGDEYDSLKACYSDYREYLRRLEAEEANYATNFADGFNKGYNQSRGITTECSPGFGNSYTCTSK